MKPHIILLAGGSGKRLWPLSTAQRPKQVIPFLGRSTLLQQTIDRMAPLGLDQKDITIVTTAAYESLIREVVATDEMQILAEPVGKNTACALLYALMSHENSYQGKTLLIMPADHFIPDAHAWCSVMDRAARHVDRHGGMALVGIKPTAAETGYGYIQVAAGQGEPFVVAKFHEKPCAQDAQRYRVRDDFWWNSGVVIARAESLLEAFIELMPDLCSAMRSCKNNDWQGYELLPAHSFDRAILERSCQTVLFPCRASWYDVGDIDRFVELERLYGFGADLHVIGGDNNRALASKKVVFVGVSDLCLVETDEAIVVFDRQKKDLVAHVYDDIEQRQKGP